MKFLAPNMLLFILSTNFSINGMCLDSSSEQLAGCFHSLVEPETESAETTFLKGITLDNWLYQPQATQTMLRILKIFNSRTYEWLSDKSLWVDGRCPSGIISRVYSGSFRQTRGTDTPSFCSPFMPFLVKWVIPQNCICITIGDIHGNFDALGQIIENMTSSILHNQRIFQDSDNMLLYDNVRIIFLGDFMDRAPDSLTVFTTAALLSLKNPGQVLMLRGNHEDISGNLNIYQLSDEIMRKASGPIPQNAHAENPVQATLDELAKAYEALPLGAFVGYQGGKPTKFIFYVHACIDPRINYSELLEHNSDYLSKNGGLFLWSFGRQNLMSPQKLSLFLNDIVPNFKTLMTVFSEELTFPHPASGFMWNDITIELDYAFVGSNRGKCALLLGIDFIKDFLYKFNSDNTKVCGLIRGHQHSLPKQLNAIQRGVVEPLSLTSPSCALTIPVTHMYHLLRYNDPFPSEYGFGIITIISASINYVKDPASFPPTFLLSLCSKDGYPETRAIFNENLVE